MHAEFGYGSNAHIHISLVLLTPWDGIQTGVLNINKCLGYQQVPYLPQFIVGVVVTVIWFKELHVMQLQGQKERHENSHEQYEFLISSHIMSSHLNISHYGISTEFGIWNSMAHILAST